MTPRTRTVATWAFRIAMLALCVLTVTHHDPAGIGFAALIALEPFTNVTASGLNTMTTQRIYPNTLEYLVLVLGGGTAPTKAQVSNIKIRLGQKPIWDVGNVTAAGSVIDAIAKYEGRVTTSTILVLPFSNPFARTPQQQFQGAIDFGSVNVRDMTFEITLTGGTTPTLTMYAQVSPPKLLTAAENLLFRAILKTPLSPSAATSYAPFLINYNQSGGALLRRLVFTPTSTPALLVTATEIKRDGLDIYEQIAATTTNAIESELFPHTPQTNYLFFDVIEDNIEKKALTSIRQDSKGNISIIPQQILLSNSGAGTYDVYADVLANLNGL